MCSLILLSYYICLMIFVLAIDYPVRHLSWQIQRGSISSCSRYAATAWSQTQSWVALCAMRSMKDLAYLCNICLNTYGLCVVTRGSEYLSDCIYPMYICIYMNSCLYVGLSIAYPNHNICCLYLLYIPCDVLRGRRLENRWWAKGCRCARAHNQLRYQECCIVVARNRNLQSEEDDDLLKGTRGRLMGLILVLRVL